MFKKVFAFILALTMVMSVPTAAEQSANANEKGKENNETDGLSSSSYSAMQEDILGFDMLDMAVALSSKEIDPSQKLIKEEQNITFISFDSDLNSITFEVEFQRNIKAEMVLAYKPESGSGADIELEILIDGKIPFKEATNVVLQRKWVDSGEIRKDSMGNETSPVQKEKIDWYDEALRDPAGITVNPFLFTFTEGKHTVTIKRTNEEYFSLKEVILRPQNELPAYDTYYSSISNKNKDVKEIVLQAEKASLKSKKSLTPKADRSSVDVSPASYAIDKLNYIGGDNWSNPNDTIDWKIKAEKTGWYKLAFRYRQGYVLNGNSYRQLKIDGVTPFKEAEKISFPYTTSWKLLEFSKGEKPYLIYLEEGEHTLSLSVTLGPMADIYTSLSEQIEILGEVYRKMIMIMGTDPDMNRDYDLFKQVENLDKILKDSKNELSRLSKSICGITGKRSDANTAVIDSMVDTLTKLLDNPYRTQKYKQDFYNNYCSLGAILSEFTSMPLDIDSIMFLPEKKDLDEYESNFFERLLFAIKRFFASFTNDYSSMASNSKDGNKKISLWLYWGKDQVQVLNNLIKEDFTPNYNIDVDIKITNASLIQALLSKNTPDLSLRLTGMDVMNMAMRGGLYNLEKFGDYDEVVTRFAKTASVPYEYQGGTYAIPDLQVFNMLFYRKDILKEYNMTVPETWDDFISISTFFFHNNLQVGMPNTFNTFATFLYQTNGNIYNKDKSRTAFSSKEFVDAFSTYTDFFTEYGFELAYDFYNRFRTGEMPMAIADYSQYNVLKVSAPEIDGKWAMTLLPGTVEGDNINRTGVADGSGSCILSPSENKNEAWQFLKWWMETETQINFNNECESILGPSARLTSANIEAVKGISWSKDDLNALVEQWEITNTIPETPGSYYTSRMYQQAFWEVVNSDANQRNTIVKWGKLADQEIERKRKEYNLE